MIKCTILISRKCNKAITSLDGEIVKYIDEITDLCGGCTIEGVVDGFYISTDGQVVFDQCYKVWVVCAQALLSQIRNIAAQIARDFRQESVYLEWKEANVEFIKPTSSDDKK